MTVLSRPASRRESRTRGRSDRLSGLDACWPDPAGPRPRGDSPARFVVVEGLSAVGKSTVAPMLAEAIGAEYLPTLIPAFEDLRRLIDRSGLVMARLHFWMMC